MHNHAWSRMAIGGLLLAAGAVRAGDIAMLPSLGGSNAFAHDINESGAVVGEAQVSGDVALHAVVWVGGVPTDLGAISGDSAAWAINDAGQIVGSSDTLSRRTAMLWQNGGWTDVGADMHAVGSSVAWDINAGGLVVGQASLDGGFANGFVWDGPGTGMIAGTVPGYNGSANKGVNSAGVTVGHGFFFGDPDRAMTGVPNGKGGYDAYDIAPPGYTFSLATAVSDRGMIVGFANDGTGPGPWNAAIFGGDHTFIGLGTLPGLENSEAYDVTEAGVIVGRAWDDDGPLEPRAWVYFDGAMHDLNEFLDPDQTDWLVLLSAEAINEHNDIVGYGVTATGEIRGFVFTGVVPPACRTDLNGDGLTDTQDFLAYLNLWVAAGAGADWNLDGAVDTMDFLAFLNEWVSCR